MLSLKYYILKSKYLEDNSAGLIQDDDLVFVQETGELYNRNTKFGADDYCIFYYDNIKNSRDPTYNGKITGANNVFIVKSGTVFTVQQVISSGNNTINRAVYLETANNNSIACNTIDISVSKQNYAITASLTTEQIPITFKTINGSTITGEGDIIVIPEIGENGNWYINGEDTGKPARGASGVSLGEIELASYLSTDEGSENRAISQKIVSLELNNVKEEIEQIQNTNVFLTEEQYNSIEPDSNKLYFIYEE